MAAAPARCNALHPSNASDRLTVLTAAVRHNAKCLLPFKPLRQRTPSPDRGHAVQPRGVAVHELPARPIGVQLLINYGALSKPNKLLSGFARPENP
jgi:hypothetical protein